MSATVYGLGLDRADADLLAAEHVGLAELSLWYSAETEAGAGGMSCGSTSRQFVIVLNDATVLAVFADVLHGLRCAQAVA